MSTDEAARKVRELCLALPDTQETTPWGAPHFRVGKKIFAGLDEKDGTVRLTVQLEPEHASTLVDQDPRFEWYPRQKHVVSMDVTRVKNWAEVKALIEESYRLAAPTKSTPTKRAPTQRAPKKPAVRKRPST